MDEIAKRVHDNRNSVSNFFQKKWSGAIQNSEFYRLIQYSSEQLRKAGQQNRVPYVLDYITLVMNTLLGDQRDNRTDITYLPFEEKDDVRAELLNTIKDSVLKQNYWTYLESDIFQDGLIEKTGACGYEWSTERNPIGELKILRIPQAQLMWDLDRREYDLKDAKWISRTRLYGKEELKQKYPEFKKYIDKMSFSSDDLDDLKLNSTYTKQIVDKKLGAVGAIEYYEKLYHTNYFIRINQEIKEGSYDSKREAEKAIKELKAQRDGLIAQLNNAGKIVPPDQIPQLSIFPYEVPYISKSEITQNITFLNEEEQEYNFFPIDVFHSFWHDGEWWSAMDLFKDAQQFINKMFSQIDHQIASGSKGMLFVDDNIPDTQFQEIVNTFSKTGGAMKLKDPKNNIFYVPPTGFDPRLISAMELAVVNLEKKAGGQNFLGGKESSAESGVTVRQRIERGGVSSFPIFDNFDRFKMLVGEKVAWFLSNLMTASQKIRIEGDELTQLAKQEFPDWFKPSLREGIGFLEINTAKENSIQDLKVDIIIDKSRHTVTKNQNILVQLGQLMQSSPKFADSVPPELLIQVLDLPASTKRKMMVATEKNAQMNMELAKMKENKPPTLSATLADISTFSNDPNAQAQFAQKFGIQLSSPVEPNTKDNEILLKAKIDAIRQNTDIGFKNKKHEEQIMAKTLDNMANRDLEYERLKKEDKNAVQE